MNAVSNQKLFPLGTIAGTPDALHTLIQAGKTVVEYLRRHEAGDWGDLCDEDKDVNREALENGGRILSSYYVTPSDKIWIITEADRSVTTVLLPSEY
jgi:hypothetical protein